MTRAREGKETERREHEEKERKGVDVQCGSVFGNIVKRKILA